MAGTLYFVQEGKVGAVKIGWTSNDVMVRCKNLQTGNSERLHLLGTIADVEQAVEAAWHKRFSDARKRAEWFHPVATLLAAIEADAAAPAGREPKAGPQPVYKQARITIDPIKTPNLVVLADWMRQNNVNMTALAKRAGLSKGYMCELLLGKRPLPLKSARCLEGATDGAVKAAQLLGLAVVA